jgi:Fuc2NAc and GlcNAc transferase
MIYLVSFILGATGAWFVSHHAYALGLIDKPCARSSHKQPTPKGGGLGILFAFVFACSFQGVGVTFWLPAVVLAALSLFDDRVDLSPWLRLIVQFGAAGLFLSGFDKLPVVGLPADISSGLHFFVLIPFFLFMALFIVGTANFYNFMDGINGVAGITGVVGFGLLGSYGLMTGQQPELIMLAFCVACACAGFLPFNVPRARVFMGDVGSILLGFVFVCLVVSFARTAGDFVVLASFLFPFYADELVTMAERFYDRQPLTRPHRRHLYQVLANEAKIPHWKVSFGYGAMQLFVGLSVWWALRTDLFWGIGILMLFAAGFVLINVRIKSQYGVLCFASAGNARSSQC